MAKFICDKCKKNIHRLYYTDSSKWYQTNIFYCDECKLVFCIDFTVKKL